MVIKLSQNRSQLIQSNIEVMSTVEDTANRIEAKELSTPKEGDDVNFDELLATFTQHVDNKDNEDEEVKEVDRFDSIYDEESRKQDEIARRFMCPIAIEFATNEPVLMHGVVYERKELEDYFYYKLIDDAVDKEKGGR